MIRKINVKDYGHSKIFCQLRESGTGGDKREEVKQRLSVAGHERFLQQGENDEVRLAEVDNE